MPGPRKASSTRFSSGTPAAGPSVYRITKPSSRRSAGRGGCAAGGADRGRLGHLTHADAGQRAGDLRGPQRIEVGVARQPHVERLELLGGLEQQQGAFAAAVGRERDLGTQHVGVGALQPVERARHRDGQQLQGSVGAHRPDVWPAPQPAPGRPGGQARSSAGRPVPGKRPQRRGHLAPAPSRRSARDPPRHPRRARTPPGHGARHGDPGRRRDRSPRPAPGARCAALRRRPFGRSSSAAAGGGTGLACRSRRARPQPPVPRPRGLMPSSSVARHTSNGSSSGSAAATSNSMRVSAGSGVSCRWKLSSIRLGSGAADPNPQVSSARVNPRGSSSSASGLPRVSAMIRSRTRSSTSPGNAERSSSRASTSDKPATTSSGRPVDGPSSAAPRDPNTNATDSATSRRATNANTCAEARSSH